MIRVLCGVQGAGKSSVLGSFLQRGGAAYYDPDAHAAELLAADPSLDRDAADSLAWHRGRRRLQDAVDHDGDCTIETTLGNNTMPGLITQAVDRGRVVELWYVGLDTVDRHIARVQQRVASGRHPVPEAKIRKCFDESHACLVRLAPRVAQLLLFDNSPESPDAPPPPSIQLEVEHGQVVGSMPRAGLPAWVLEVFDAVGAP